MDDTKIRKAERRSKRSLILPRRRIFGGTKVRKAERKPKKTTGEQLSGRMQAYKRASRIKVRIKGLEPPRRKASDPKSDVATNYTISASSGTKVGKFS